MSRGMCLNISYHAKDNALKWSVVKTDEGPQCKHDIVAKWRRSRSHNSSERYSGARKSRSLCDRESSRQANSYFYS